MDHYPDESLLLGLAYRHQAPNGQWRIKLRWKRLLITLGILGIIVYTSLLSALYIYLREAKHYENISYWKTLVLPLRMEAYKRELGEHQIEQAFQKLEEGEAEAALALLRSGVRRCPDHAKARIMLSQFYMRLQRSDLAVKILQDALQPNLEDPDYISIYFKTLFDARRDDLIMEEAKRLIPQISDSDIRHNIALSAAKAHAFQGQYDEAEAYIVDYQLDDTIEGLRLAANIAWQRGDKETAMTILEKGVEKESRKLLLYQLLSQFSLEQGDYGRARRYCVLMNTHAPLAYQPNISLLYIFSQSDETRRKENLIERVLNDFGDDAEAMAALSRFAARDHNTALALTLVQKAQDKGWPISDFTLNYLKALVLSGNNQEAVAYGEHILSERPAWLEEVRGTFSGLLSAAYFGLGNKNLGDVYLETFLQKREMRPEGMMDIAKVFEEVGLLEHSRTILLQTYEANKRSQPLLTEMIRIELALGHADQIQGHLNALLEMRQPPRKIIVEAYHALASDRFLFMPERQPLLERLQQILN